MRIQSVTVLVCAVLLFALAGCPSSSTGPDLERAPVEGTVTMDGKPVAGATVMFGNGVAMGETDANGHYVLAGAENKKGVTLGEHQVVIEKWVNADGSPYKSAEMSPMDAGAKQEIPPQYSNPEKTQLKATVKAGGGTFDFELKSSGKPAGK